MNFKFQLNTRITILTVCVLPLLIFLGFWQLSRADEKRAIQQAFEQKQQQDPVPIQQLILDQDDQQLAFTPVSVTGEFDQTHIVLLDNQVVNGHVGYDVLVPLQLASALSDSSKESSRTEPQLKELWVLVNRGWVQAPATRDQLPDIPPLSDAEMELQGSVYVSPGEAFLLAEQNWQDQQWPLVIQSVDVSLLSKTLERNFFPFEVRLQASEPVALNAHWQAVSVQPEKHIAYAVQWFAMAIGLVFWFMFAQTNCWSLLTQKSK